MDGPLSRSGNRFRQDPPIRTRPPTAAACEARAAPRVPHHARAAAEPPPGEPRGPCSTRKGGRAHQVFIDRSGAWSAFTNPRSSARSTSGPRGSAAATGRSVKAVFSAEGWTSPSGIHRQTLRTGDLRQRARQRAFHIRPTRRRGRRRAIREGRVQRGSVDEPIRYSSTALAHWRPSRIAHTTRLCPRRMSPAAKTFGTLVA
jgi:hypothetical protein